MNKKLIAVAVSSALAAPVIAQAEGEVKLYGRIDQRLIFNDPQVDDSTTDFGSSSRFGIKYNNELGNGLSVHAHYEFDIATDRELNGTRLGDVRLATAGVSGAFGRVDIGNQWSAYFDTFGTFASPVIAGTTLFSLSGGPLRTSNTIKYSNTFGPVYLELDGRLNDSDGSNTAEKLRGDGIGIGVKISAGEYVTVGLAADYEDHDHATIATEEITRYGIAVEVQLGDLPVSVAGTWHSADIEDRVSVNAAGAGVDQPDIDQDLWSLWVAGDLTENTRWQIGYGDLSDDGNGDADQFSWSISHIIGGGLRVYYAGDTRDSDQIQVGDDAGIQDGTTHTLGFRVDF